MPVRHAERVDRVTAATLETHLARLKGRGYPWPVPWEAVELIARSEGCELVAYLCPAGVWTIGWGETASRTIRKGMRWTAEQADSRFLAELERYADEVADLLRPDTTPGELGAMTSLAYNIGLAAFEKSSVRRLHEAGDEAGAARAFALWNKARDPATGQLREVRGLTIRRGAEAALYLRPDPEARHERMPQAIAPESKLAASPIAQGGATAAAGGVAVVAPALAPVLEQADVARGALATLKALGDQAQEFLGFPPVVLLGVVLIAAGWLVVRWRAKQRAGGWA